ncbi:sulfate adenylyltransferase [Microbacterium resistens]|uniref:sulfate adenylyltransferase subunit 1 n=1 Tax=Microbacterium resistens TaxID=156977 RepID=UPI001C578859|nr:GTP-binding protein [Microbacterium resistens]MBW1639827.1 sulfate adenylyltransferase [Microbacterium resistens]
MTTNIPTRPAAERRDHAPAAAPIPAERSDGPGRPAGIGTGGSRPKDGGGLRDGRGRRAADDTDATDATDPTPGLGAHPETTLFRFATAGSVDDGKSTLVGRLLHDAKAILADQLEQVTRTTAERGFAHGAVDFALLTDGLRAEREQGITIDVAYRYFATGARGFILADCPGHVQYTRNMVTGAATADAVVVLVDARKGVVEQTRRHLAVVSLLRVPHVLVAVNKIDLTGFDEERFRTVEREVVALAAELGLSRPHVLPVSALEGDNVAEPSDRTPWYGEDGVPGPTLLELLESLPTRAEADAEAGGAPFRLPVQTVIRPQGGLSPLLDDGPETAERYRDFRGFAGRVSSGSLTVGDRVQVFPGGHVTTVTEVLVAGSAAPGAREGQSVVVTLADEVDAARGALIAAHGSVPAGAREAEAEVFVLDDRPIRPGDRLLAKHGTTTVQAVVSEVRSQRDLDTLAATPAAALGVNDIGRVRLRFAAALPVEPYRENREGGALLLIHPVDGATLAAATVVGSDPR